MTVGRDRGIQRNKRTDLFLVPAGPGQGMGLGRCKDDQGQGIASTGGQIVNNPGQYSPVIRAIGPQLIVTIRKE